MTKQIER